MQAPLILIDGSSYFFRAFHALPPLTNSKGQPTGAMYGVANMIKKLIKDYQPDQVAVVFDAKGKTFRDDLYPQYKATRAVTPPDLSSQFEPLMALIRAMGLPLLIVDGVEADDVIGTLARLAQEQGRQVVISTGDKDMAQLVNEHVSLINTMSNTAMDIQGVKDKFGVDPEQIVDYLALIGDSVDNVPGVAKCGPKTAAKWLLEHQTLDNLITNAHTITGKVGEYLRESLAFLPLAKQLVTIKTDVELPLTLADLTPQKTNIGQLLELVREMEFKNWLRELLETGSANNETVTTSEEPPPLLSSSVEIVTKPEQFALCLNKLKTSAIICLNTEITTVDPISAQLVGIAFAMENEKPIYIPLTHIDGSKQLIVEEVLTALKPILEDPKIQKVGQNLRFDYHIFKNYGITLQGIAFDTMLESYVLNSNASRHDIDSLALKYLGLKTITFEEVVGKGVKQLNFNEIAVDAAAVYATKDVEVTLALHHKLYTLMDEALHEIFHSIEMPLLTVLANIEREGVCIDAKVLAKHGERLKARILMLETEALTIAGKPFNLNSPKQLQTILFDELKIPVTIKTPTGQASTAEAVLQELAYEYRLPAIILEYRGLTKLVSTYIDALPKKINPHTQRVHTSYNQAVAATGRLSSSEPNLQNIPIRSEEGRLIRTAFIAPPGHILLAADYSQIELRIMAHLSQDPNLLKAFANGWDIHTATASEIFQVPLDSVTHEQRRRSKAVNFGLIYGMSAFGLSKQIDVSRADAQSYMDIYFERYPGVLHYMEETRKKAHIHGYVETIFGRRLYLPEINTKNMARQKAAERAAINAPMQGTAADIIKKSMIAIANWQSNDAKMIMQVHDELVFEVAEHAIEESTIQIQQLMENTVQLSVPLLVTIGIGKNWDEAH